MRRGVKHVRVSNEIYCTHVPGALKATKGSLGWISKLNIGCEFCRQEYKLKLSILVPGCVNGILLKSGSFLGKSPRAKEWESEVEQRDCNLAAEHKEQKHLQCL